MNKTKQIITIAFLTSINAWSYGANDEIQQVRNRLAFSQTCTLTCFGVSFYAHYKLLETNNPAYGVLFIGSTCAFFKSHQNSTYLERRLFSLQQQHNHHA